MPLQHITASAGGTLNSAFSNLDAEAIRLPAGRSALNRRTDGPTALIVAEGEIAIGTLDDRTSLSAGEGVLLAAGAPYSLVAESDSLALLFSLPAAQPSNNGDIAELIYRPETTTS